VESDIRDNPAMSRFEMPLGDTALAVAYYKVEDGRVVVLHTEVPQELSGLGYGSLLAHGVFEALRRDGKRVIAKCPFMSSYAVQHPEYAALLGWLIETDGTHARTTLKRRYPRLSNACPKGISDFVCRVRSSGSAEHARLARH